MKSSIVMLVRVLINLFDYLQLESLTTFDEPSVDRFKIGRNIFISRCCFLEMKEIELRSQSLTDITSYIGFRLV